MSYHTWGKTFSWTSMKIVSMTMILSFWIIQSTTNRTTLLIFFTTFFFLLPMKPIHFTKRLNQARIKNFKNSKKSFSTCKNHPILKTKQIILQQNLTSKIFSTKFKLPATRKNVLKKFKLLHKRRPISSTCWERKTVGE